MGGFWMNGQPSDRATNLATSLKLPASIKNQIFSVLPPMRLVLGTLKFILSLASPVRCILTGADFGC
jgi:hypothetical protein